MQWSRWLVWSADWPSHISGHSQLRIWIWWTFILLHWYRCWVLFLSQPGKEFHRPTVIGIRSFDIDTCYKDDKVMNCHCGAGSCAYTSSMEKALQQIDAWMKTHTSEVIVIIFGCDAQEDYRKEIAQGLKFLLLKLWDPSSSNNPTMSTYYNNNNQWPTLRKAIQSRQRILIFMDNNLSN